MYHQCPLVQNAVHIKKQQSHAQQKPTQQRHTVQTLKQKCPKCRNQPQHAWNQGKCPAKGSICCNYHKANHRVAVWCNRGMSFVNMETAEDWPDEEIQDINLTQEETPLAVVTEDKWLVNISILSQIVQFRIDTRVKCNTVNSYPLLRHTGELRWSNRILRSYSNHKLRPVTAVDLTLR